ncbi:MAG: LysR substrate-binding domain-containing protein [Polyangiales bacterium]
MRLACAEDRFDWLLGGLATHSLDVVLSDTPCPPSSGVKAFNRLLGECVMTFFAHRKLAPKLHRTFPQSLTGAPMLMPAEGTSVGRAIRQRCESYERRPDVFAEFDDSALMKTFGQDGLGLFPIPWVIEAEVKQQYGVHVIGRTDEIRARFYAISSERRLKNQAASAICEAARQQLFGED